MYNTFLAWTFVLLLSIAAGLVLLIIVIRIRHNKIVEERKALQQAYELQLQKAQIEIQENTFTTLAQELHDNIGQLFSSAIMQLNIVQIKQPLQPNEFKEAFSTISNGIEEIRTLSKILNKDWLKQFSLLTNISNELSRLEKSYTIEKNIQLQEPLQLTHNEQLILFRIIQELLQNIVKHAQATLIKFTLTENEQEYIFSVVDNGIGFKQEQTKAGNGLLHIKQRAVLINAQITVMPLITGTGFTLQIAKNKQYEQP